MEPYAPIRGADPFAASMKLVTALVAELQAPGAAGLTAYELEQFAGRALHPPGPHPGPGHGMAVRCVRPPPAAPAASSVSPAARSPVAGKLAD